MRAAAARIRSQSGWHIVLTISLPVAITVVAATLISATIALIRIAPDSTQSRGGINHSA